MNGLGRHVGAMADDAITAWTAAMHREDFPAAWAISRAVRNAADPAGCDDIALPYHRRWVWDGTPVDGRSVLVRCYHGLGDTLQFARFLPALTRRAAAVMVEAQASLVPLLTPIVGDAQVVPFNPARPLPPADCTLEITDLSAALELMPGAVPVPYLDIDSAALPPGTIGLCHRAGNWDDDRSLPADLLTPLCRLAPAVTLVAEPSALPVLNPQGCPFDMVATARLVQACALVITVDTMIAHLAGALGRPTWLLLKAEADWRWSPGRETCWYPTMRLYHQSVPGGWAAVLAEIEDDLAVLDQASAA